MDSLIDQFDGDKAVEETNKYLSFLVLLLLIPSSSDSPLFHVRMFSQYFVNSIEMEMDSFLTRNYCDIRSAFILLLFSLHSK